MNLKQAVAERVGEEKDFPTLLILVDGSVVNLLEGKAFIFSHWCIALTPVLSCVPHHSGQT